MKVIQFTGKFKTLIPSGFRFQKLYDNQIFYTTWESRPDNHSDIFIRKANRLVTFDGYNHNTSARILETLINNEFLYPYFDRQKVSEDNFPFSRLERVFDGTLSDLKHLWNDGNLKITEV